MCSSTQQLNNMMSLVTVRLKECTLNVQLYSLTVAV